MLYAATTFKYVFDYHDEDIYWCTADVGWITGHTYVCYGPLLNGATNVIVRVLSLSSSMLITILIIHYTMSCCYILDLTLGFDIVS